MARLYRPVPLLIAAACLGYATLQPYVERWLPDLDQRAEYRLPAGEIQITPAGEWVPENLIVDAIRRAGLPDPLPLLSDRLVKQVAGAFAAHPWVSEVRSVRKTAAKGLLVDVVYRTPVLMVQTKRGLYPVDRGGVLLPPGDFTLDDAARFPVLVNVRSVPQGPAGTAWGDAAVEGAALLAEVLAPDQDLDRYWRPLGLRAIGIREPEGPANDPGAVVLELLTDSGTRIVWGHAPGADVLEPSAEQKLDRLCRYHSYYGGFDRPHGPTRMNIRHWEAIEQQPLGARAQGVER